MYDIQLASPDPSGPRFDLWTDPSLMIEAARLQELEPKLLTVYKGQFRAAVLALYEKRRLGGLHLQSASGSYYQGLRFWHQQETPAARRLLDELQICSAIARFIRARYRGSALNLIPSIQDVRGFTWNGLNATPLYTFEQDLADSVTPLRDEREKLHRAQERGYGFEAGLDADAFLGLSNAMQDRKGHKAYSKPARMKAYIENLHAAGLLEQYNVVFDGRIISSNILLTDQSERAYTVLRASDRSEMRNGVSLWHTVKLLEALKGRFATLDLCGANVPEVARFKAALGLRLKLFFRISG